MPVHTLRQSAVMFWLGAHPPVTETYVMALKGSTGPTNMCHHGCISWGNCWYCLPVNGGEGRPRVVMRSLQTVPNPLPGLYSCRRDTNSFTEKLAPEFHPKWDELSASLGSWGRWQTATGAWWAILRYSHTAPNRVRREKTKREVCVVLQDRPVCMTGG